jgi:hypothetical protein
MNASKLLAGGLLLGMGLATGGAMVSAAAAGVGVNWLGEGVAGLWSGLAAPPETALGRAYTGAIRKGVAELKARYRQGVDPRSDLAAFDLVAACADHVAGAEFPAGAVDVDGAQRGLSGALAALLHGHDPRQVEFLQQELLPACAAAFQTQLLKDSDAWRAFHGLILQGLARNFGALTAQMAEFPTLLAAWGDPATSRDHLRHIEDRIDALARQPAAAPIFDNRGLRVGGNVYQAGRDQYVSSAHAGMGGAATVINNFGGSSPAPAPPTPATLLFLAANPLGTEHLRLDEEARQVTAALRQGGRRLDLAQAWAVRGEELLDALLDHRPAIVHFAGHGDEDCLILEGVDGQPAILAGEALAALLGAAGGVRCVVLNACWSDALAEALLRVVPCVVGMAADLNDRAAIAFAAGFYRMLGLGESVAGAVAGGQAQMLAEGLPATFTGQVRLRTAPGVDLSSMCIP